jgi:long-chain acyl-CoA synthetase
MGCYHKIDIGAATRLLVKRKVIARIQEEIDLLNVKFGSGRKSRFELTPDIWSRRWSTDTYTKTKRKVVMEKYIHLFHKIYN